MRKSDSFQAPIKAAAIGGIFFFWAALTIEALKIAWHIIHTSPEETFTPVTKAVCGHCQELYDDDEYHLIHGTHLCELAAKSQFEKIYFFNISQWQTLIASASFLKMNLQN